MKKILLLIILTLSLGLNSAQAQVANKLTGTLWVLQNPELAVEYTIMSFFSNGQGTIDVTNLLTDSKRTTSFNWKENDTPKNSITITINGTNFVYDVSFFSNNNSMHLTNRYDFNDLNILAKGRTSEDTYVSKVQSAVEMYGNDASMRKFGLPSSSRETGYSTYPRYSKCYSCFGTGRCSLCNGAGRITFNYIDYTTCSFCYGTGTCKSCQGQGIIKNY